MLHEEPASDAMADFDAAYSRTAAIEGGYVHHPRDRGGETYRGISRRRHPHWSGWRAVDAAKPEADFPAVLERSRRLARAVKHFYRVNYWDRFRGDQIPDQSVADELFDTAVNMGVATAVRFLQRSLNLLNRDEKNYTDIVVDGVCGEQTLTTLATLLALDRKPGNLLCLMNVLQGARYVDLVRRHPDQEEFIRGWLKRLSTKSGLA